MDPSGDFAPASLHQAAAATGAYRDPSRSWGRAAYEAIGPAMMAMPGGEGAEGADAAAATHNGFSPMEAAQHWRTLYRSGDQQGARQFYNEHSLVAPDEHSEPFVQAVAKTPSRTGGNVPIGQRLGNEFRLVPQGSTDLGAGLNLDEFHIHNENGVPIGAAGVSYRGDPQTATLDILRAVTIARSPLGRAG
jgi:hypothetical protein